MWPVRGAIGPYHRPGPIGLNVPVTNSELATRVSDGSAVPPPGVGRLIEAVPGRRLRVVEIGADHESALVQEGLAVGSEITVERRLALGGPLIVHIGRTRLALARSVAGTIRVVAADEATEPGRGT
jgi:Fe2+ transport system protein FeoA